MRLGKSWDFVVKKRKLERGRLEKEWGGRERERKLKLDLPG